MIAAAACAPARATARVRAHRRRLLRRRFGHLHALQPDVEPRVVHHREHRAHSAEFGSDQLADAIVVIAKGQHAGRRSMQPHLVLDRRRPDVVGLAGVRRVGFGHKEQRDPSRSCRRVGRTGKHQVNDVLGKFVVAEGDEDLGPLIDQVPSSRGVAAVRSAPTSLPACGSVRFIVPVHSPVASLGR